MKTLKRPMFRKGGNVGNGIMTGIRDNFEVGGPVSAKERLEAVAAQYGQTGFDPLTQFLIQGGLKLASAPATGGGVIADIATAAEQPTAQLFQSVAERDKLRRELALAGEQLDIQQEREEAARLADEKLRRDLLETELESREKIAKMQTDAVGDEKKTRLTDKYFTQYNDYILAGNRAEHDITDVPGQVRAKFGKDQYGGLLEGGDIYKQAQKLGKKDNVGKVYYDLVDGKPKRLMKTTTGDYGWQDVTLTGKLEEGVGQPSPDDTATNQAKEMEGPLPNYKPESEYSLFPGTVQQEKNKQEFLKRRSERLKDLPPIGDI